MARQASVRRPSWYRRPSSGWMTALTRPMAPRSMATDPARAEVAMRLFRRRRGERGGIQVKNFCRGCRPGSNRQGD